MSNYNESIQKFTSNENSNKKIIDDQTSSSFCDSGFITESCEISAEQSGIIADSKKFEETDDSMTMAKSTATGNSQSKDSEIENYTDSGIVSCSNISSTATDSQSKVAVRDVQPYVPDYLIRQRNQMQHPNLQIENYFEQDEDGYTKLHIAILHNIQPAIQVLINFAPDASYLNIRNFCGQTALHLAVLMSQSQVVRKLIDAGADINVRDNKCNSPLHLSVLNQDMNCVRTILAAIFPGNKSLIANLEQWNYEGETCFYVASKLRDIPIMKLLANSGANVNAREGRSGYSPLHYAVETRAESVIKFLCECCVDSLNLDYENYGGLTAFQLSLLTNQEALAEYLVKKGASAFYTPESDFDDDEIDDDDDDDVSINDYDEMEKNQLVNKIAEIAVN